MGAYYLIVNDAEFRQISDRLLAFWTSLETNLQEYEGILRDVSTNGLISGKQHDVVVLYLETVEKLRTIVQGTGEKAAVIVDDFLSSIETADTFLYEAKYGVLRYFDDLTFEKLIKCVDHPLSSLTDAIGDFLLKKIFKFAQKLGWDAALKELHTSYRLLFDFLNIVEKDLITIFDGVHEIDNQYGYNIDNGTGDGFFQLSKLGGVSMTMFVAEEMLDAMQEMLNEENDLSMTDIKSRIESIFSELNEYAEEVQKTTINTQKPTSAQIKEAVNKQSFQKIISQSQTDLRVFIVETNASALEIALSEWKNVIKDMFKSYIDSNELNIESYEEYLIMCRIMDSLAEIEDGERKSNEITEADVEEYLKDTKLGTVLKLISKYGAKAKEYCEPNLQDLVDVMTDNSMTENEKIAYLSDWLENDKELGKLIKGADNALLILKYGEQGLKLLARYALNYDRSLEILDSFEKNCGNDQQTRDCIKKIRALYEKEAVAWVKELAKTASDAGVDLALKAVGKSFPLFGTISQILDTGLDVLGCKDKQANTYLAYQLQTVTYDSWRSYERAVEAFNAADPEDPEYEKLANDVYNMFTYHKQNMIAAYDAMASASSGDKAAYYRYCKLQISKMNMTSDKDFYIMSYEDFQKLDRSI